MFWVFLTFSNKSYHQEKSNKGKIDIPHWYLAYTLIQCLISFLPAEI